ncbi:MAG: hypothetical protein GY950_23910 [bacterium]|nr:hypothetical protein [bacterium]
MKKKLVLLTIVLMLALLFAGTPVNGKTIPLTGLMKPSGISVDAAQIYISDETTVYIYSLTDFSLKTKFGKKGEGPREFLVHSSFGVGVIPQKDTDVLVVNSLGKVSYFTKQGKFIKGLKTGSSAAFSPLGDNFTGTNEIAEGKDTFHTLNIYDRKFKKVREIIRWLHPIQESKMEILLVPLYTQAHIYNDKIFVARGSGFIIDVFNGEGEKLYSLEHPYEKRKVTEAYKKTTLDFFKTDPRWRNNFELIKSMARFPGYFHAIRYFQVNDGGIYVQTYGEKEGKSEFYIFDIKGKFIKKVYVPFLDDMGINIVPRHTISGGKFYQLAANDETEEWELHVHEMH